MKEWGAAFGGTPDTNCSIVGDFISVTCLTREKTCSTFQDGLNYDPTYCCQEALALTYPM
jgi:hypothetical protein